MATRGARRPDFTLDNRQALQPRVVLVQGLHAGREVSDPVGTEARANLITALQVVHDRGAGLCRCRLTHPMSFRLASRPILNVRSRLSRPTAGHGVRALSYRQPVHARGA